MDKLKKILAKDPATLTADEKAIVAKNWDILNEDIRSKFADCKVAKKEAEEDDEEEDDEEDEEIDEKSLKTLISKASKENLDSTIDAITKGIADRFKTSYDAAKKEFIETGVKKGNKENDAITRKFIHALKSKDTAVLKELAMKAIDTTDDGSGADAGFLIPEPLANEVIRLESLGYGKARELFSYNLLTQGNTKRVTALGSVLSVYWTDEGEKKQASQPSFDIVTLALKKLAVIVPMTEEVVEDAGVDLTAMVGQLIREAIDKEVDLQFFMGDGTVWTGIFNDTTIPTTELAANAIGSAMRPEDIIALADDTPLGVNGRYLMHRTVLSRVRTLRQNADGTGDYLYNVLGNGGGGNNGEFNAGTINGWPVELIEAGPTYASTLFDGNKPIMMFGDFKRGVAYGEKSDVRLKMLDQATITDSDGETVINLAEQDMIALRAVQRVGFKVVLPTAMRRLVTGD